MKVFHQIILTNDFAKVRNFVSQATFKNNDIFTPDEYGRYPSNITFISEVDPEIIDYIVVQECKAVRRRECKQPAETSKPN